LLYPSHFLKSFLAFLRLISRVPLYLNHWRRWPGGENNQDATDQAEIYGGLDTVTGLYGGGEISGNTVIGDGTKSAYGIQVGVTNGATSNKRLTASGNSFNSSLPETKWWLREVTTNYAPTVTLVLNTVPPVSGNWIAGDRTWKEAPSANTPPGSVCITSGTGGGTWKAMAALAP